MDGLGFYDGGGSGHVDSVGLELFFFFFQAEDGIRDDLVTGVQTCALPIFGYWYNWQRDPTHFAKLVSSVWAGEYELATERYNSGEFFAGDCSVSFCDEVALCPPSIRNDPLGGLQWLNPTTGHWEPLPGSGQDPRTDGTVPPPWMSPPLGQTGNCLAAANITEFFKAHNDNVIAQLGISAGLFAVVPAIMALLDLIFLPIGLIATVAVELAASYIAYRAAPLSAP